MVFKERRFLKFTLWTVGIQLRFTNYGPHGKENFENKCIDTYELDKEEIYRKYRYLR